MILFFQLLLLRKIISNLSREALPTWVFSFLILENLKTLPLNTNVYGSNVLAWLENIKYRPDWSKTKSCKKRHDINLNTMIQQWPKLSQKFWIAEQIHPQDSEKQERYFGLKFTIGYAAIAHRRATMFCS